MTLECLYYAAGVFSSFVGLLGVIGLAFYAADTRKMRIAAQQQLELPITPCVLIIGHPQETGLDGPISIKNFGLGPAINLRWRYRKDQNWAGNEFPALVPGEDKKMPSLIKDVLNRGGAIECEFESLSGARYLTVSGFSENTQNFDFLHEFRRLPPKK